jgi:putative exporter of polyketide antibiotics
VEPPLNEKGEEAGPPHATTEGLWQFWSLPVKLVVGSVFVYVGLLYIAGTAVHSISAAAAESVAGVFATLLGLTFTAFSFLSAFMPVLRRDFVKSRTFLVMGQTFVVTMMAQISTFALAWTSYLFHDYGWSANLGFLIVPLALISIALMATLITDLYWMFTAARNQLPNE